MNYSKLPEDILNLNSKVRFAGVCNDTGEIKYGGQREGIEDLLMPEDTKKSNIQAIAMWGLRKSLGSRIGKGLYAMAEYEKIKLITFPLENDQFLLVTTEVESDHNNIISNVLRLLKS
ncbi:MAG TPA: hypothetical protein VH500_01590 [Nitrososphaeraceae archaeon]|jgi:hypothetical protein